VSLRQALRSVAESIRSRSIVHSWGEFKPKNVLERLSKRPRRAQAGTKGGKDSQKEPEGSGDGGGGSGGPWFDVGQAGLVIIALILYNSLTGGSSSGGRVESIDFQTFRNTVLAKDLVDKVRIQRRHWPVRVGCAFQPHCAHGNSSHPHACTSCLQSECVPLSAGAFATESASSGLLRSDRLQYSLCPMQIEIAGKTVRVFVYPGAGTSGQEGNVRGEQAASTLQYTFQVRHALKIAASGRLPSTFRVPSERLPSVTTHEATRACCASCKPCMPCSRQTHAAQTAPSAAARGAACEQRGYQWRVQVGSVESFERQLEAAQAALGWAPEEWVPVIYRDPDFNMLDELFKFLPTLLVIGALIWTSRNTMRSIGAGMGGSRGRNIFNVGKAQVRPQALQRPHAVHACFTLLLLLCGATAAAGAWLCDAVAWPCTAAAPQPQLPPLPPAAAALSSDAGRLERHPTRHQTAGD
jgi:hypothetical protein